ncbi:hypothetical protein PAPYR_13160 [Paratrimastix pyriformis]|uniref:Dynein heavy chain hydrolytic ATP-binding dynein motor region domain-containing protein n=1 Tax=Paratrimastix pyriformis TaxID=342808 RepID=A0ABQ8U0Q2_9EUKA|nr:hypothetical protein PAPYR_13160 [Paratrimastix pyriformis]
MHAMDGSSIHGWYLRHVLYTWRCIINNPSCIFWPYRVFMLWIINKSILSGCSVFLVRRTEPPGQRECTARWVTQLSGNYTEELISQIYYRDDGPMLTTAVRYGHGTWATRAGFDVTLTERVSGNHDRCSAPPRSHTAGPAGREDGDHRGSGPAVGNLCPVLYRVPVRWTLGAFRGVATGAWACFDETNYIAPEASSVVAQQIQEIQTAAARHHQVYLMGEPDALQPDLHHFRWPWNMAGRDVIPDNLALFRPIAMLTANVAQIASNPPTLSLLLLTGPSGPLRC